MREIVILGFAVDQNTQPIFDGAFGDAEIWTLNDWWNFYPRLAHPSRVYQIHEDYDSISHVGHRKITGWQEEYNASAAEIVATKRFAGVSRLRLFDLEKALAEFPKRLFTSSIAYAMMDAIMERVDKIVLKGVELKAEGEYGFQRPAICELANIAASKGVIVDAPRLSEWRQTVDWSKIKEVELRYGEVKP